MPLCYLVLIPVLADVCCAVPLGQTEACSHLVQLEHEPDGRWFWSSFIFKYLAALPWIINGMDAWNRPLSRKIARNHCHQWRNYIRKKRSLSKSTEKVQNLPNDTLDHFAKISSMSRKGRPKWIFGRDAWIKRLSRWFSGKRTHLPMQEKRVWSPGQENPLEKGMVTHSSILAWRIPWTEVPSGLHPWGLKTARHNWVTKHACTGNSIGVDFYHEDSGVEKMRFTGVNWLTQGNHRASNCRGRDPNPVSLIPESTHGSSRLQCLPPTFLCLLGTETGEWLQRHQTRAS